MSVMEQIASVGMVPMAKSEPKHHNIHQAAATLFAVFGKLDNTQTRTVLTMVSEGFTCQEYDSVEQECIKMAEKADEMAGWKPAPDAKGADKYGPRKKSMMAQASARRQVFGAAKMQLTAIVSVPDNGVINPDLLPTFTEATKRARAFLNSQGVTWDGRKKDEVKQAAENNAEFKAQYKAEEKARKETPRDPGETYQEWEYRCKTIAKDMLAEAMDKQRADLVAKIAADLVKKHGQELAADIAAKVLELCGYTEEE